MALSDNIGLIFRLKAEDQASKTIRNVENSVSHLAGVARSAGSGDISNLTESIGGLTAGLGPVGAVAAGAAAGIAAAAAVAATATVALFELSKQAAEFGSQIYDATVQTGLSAEALSSLRVAAAQSDVEFSKIIQSVTKFSVLVGEAADGSKTAEATLTKFGLTANEAMGDVEGSFARVVRKIAELPPGIQKSALAAEAFGTRGGKDMLKLIDQMDGDLPGLIAKMKELGLTIDDEAARAADEFADRMTLLGMRFDMVKVKIGNAVMPAFERFFKGLDAMLSQNQQSLDSWINRFGMWVDNVVAGFLRVASFIQDNWSWLRWVLAVSTAGGSLAAGDLADYIISSIDEQSAARQQMGTLSAAGQNASTRGEIAAPKGGGGQSGGGKKSDAAKKAREEFLKSLGLDQTELENDIERLIAYFNDSIAPKISKGIVMFSNPDEISAYAENTIEQVDAKYKEIENVLKVHYATILMDSKLSGQERENLERERNQKLADLEKQHVKDIEQIREDAGAQTSVQRERDALVAIAAAERTAAKEIAAMEKSRNFAFIKEERIKQIRIGALQVAIDQYAILADLEEQDVQRHEEWMKRLEEARKKLEELKNQETAPEDSTTPARPRGGIMGGIEESLGGGWIDEATGKLEAMRGVGQLLGETFAQMAQGIGSLLQQWILTGELGPQAMRKLTASVLAGLAAQAAVEALMELARGFAALTSPLTAWKAPLHFKAAAIFGAVAGVAAVAGRAIAGDAFKQQSGTATGQGTSSRNTSGQGMAYSGQQSTSIDENRSGPAFRPEIVISDRSGMFSQLFETEIRNNSKVRSLIIQTANS